jgi:hypothetical protein
MMLWPWTPAARKRKACWHHELLNTPDQDRLARSFIQSEFLDVGRNKRFWCDKNLGGCGKQWFAWWR